MSAAKTARPLLLKALIAIVVLGALTGIAALVTGGASIAMFLTCCDLTYGLVGCLGCLAAIERGRLVALGWVGLASNLVAMVLLLLLIWGESSGSGLAELVIRLTSSFAALGVAATYAALFSLFELDGPARILRRIGYGLAGLGALLILPLAWLDVSSDVAELTFRALGVLAVLLVAVSLAIPLTRKLQSLDIAPTHGARGKRLLRFCPSCGKGLRDGEADGLTTCPLCEARFEVEWLKG